MQAAHIHTYSCSMQIKSSQIIQTQTKTDEYQPLAAAAIESTVCAIWGRVMRVDLRYRVLPAMEKITRRGLKQFYGGIY